MIPSHPSVRAVERAPAPSPASTTPATTAPASTAPAADASATTASAADASRPAQAARERILALDVLRGIAIIGTLASNIWIFASVAGTQAESGLAAWFAEASHWLPNGKFLGLLTIMFGIGLEIQRQSALRAGRRWPGKYPIRAGLLFLDGLINFVLVVQFDVLRAYALVGLLVAFLLLLSERVQWWLIGLFLAAHTALMLGVGMGAADDGGSPDTGATGPADDPDAAGAGAAVGAGADADAAGSADAAASYGQSVQESLRSFGDYHAPGSEFFIILVMGAATFLLGTKLFRMGIFSPARSRLRWWLIGIGFGVFLPLDYVLAMVPGVPAPLTDLSRYGTSTVVALGILAAVAEFYLRRGEVGFLGRRLSEVGRMALSCYLLQNIIGVIAQHTVLPSELLAPYSSTLVTYIAFALIAVCLIVFAHLWLRRFHRGPFEQLWNWSYRKLAREN